MSQPVYRRRKTFQADVEAPASLGNLKEIVSAVSRFPDEATVNIQVLYGADQLPYYEITIDTEDGNQ